MLVESEHAQRLCHGYEHFLSMHEIQTTVLVVEWWLAVAGLKERVAGRTLGSFEKCFDSPQILFRGNLQVGFR